MASPQKAAALPRMPVPAVCGASENWAPFWCCTGAGDGDVVTTTTVSQKGVNADAVALPLTKGEYAANAKTDGSASFSLGGVIKAIAPAPMQTWYSEPSAELVARSEATTASPDTSAHVSKVEAAPIPQDTGFVPLFSDTDEAPVPVPAKGLRTSIAAEVIEPASKQKERLPTMDENDSLDRVPWCVYCICCGFGCTPHSYRFLSLMKCICCVNRCEGDAFEDSSGICGCTDACCCLTCLYQMPPRSGNTRCVCCNLHCCGNIIGKGLTTDSSGTGDRTGTYEYVLYENFAICHWLCCGLGYTPIADVWDWHTKCGCLRSQFSFDVPFGEEGCCRCHNVCCQLHCQLRLPPKYAHNPIVVCCGRRHKKAGSSATKAPSAKPKQHEMR